MDIDQVLLGELLKEGFFLTDTIFALVAAFLASGNLFYLITILREWSSLLTPKRALCWVALSLSLSLYVLYIYNSLYSEVFCTWLRSMIF